MNLAELVLLYRLEERVPVGLAAAARHIEAWTVDVFADLPGPDDRRLEIGYAKLVVFNLAPGADIGDLTDQASGTWVDRNVDERRPDRHVLLLDRLWLRPEWRGQELGPIIAAAAIERLGRGCHLAACYPAPFDEPAEHPEDRERVIQTLGALWSKVGFRHWNDGVWMLDLEATDVHAMLNELLAARAVRQSAVEVGL